jgi:hypothetical protein
MSLSLPSLPSWNLGGNEKLSDTDFLPQAIANQIYFFETAAANLAAAASFTYPETIDEPKPTAEVSSFRPELNNSSTVGAEITYNQQTKNVANGAVNGAIYHERMDAAHVNEVRRKFSDVLGGQDVA